MPESFITLTHDAWGSRILGSLKGMLVGLLIFLLSFYLLWWNEGRTVQRYQSLQEGQGAVISIGSDRIDPQHEGRLVHVQGTLRSDEDLRDPQFNIGIRKALILGRVVEMYQWQEKKESQTEKHVGGSTTTRTQVTYSKDWFGNHIDSSAFEKSSYENPQTMPFKSQKWVARQGKLGEFVLSEQQIKKVEQAQPISIESARFSVGRPHLVIGNLLYIGKDPRNPQVGDIRIAFSYMTSADITAIAKQSQNRLMPYLTTQKDEIMLLEPGYHTPEALFSKAQTENTLMAWAIRVGGVVLMWLGITLMLKPVVVLMDVIPFMGNLVSYGLSTISFIIALVLSLMTIAMAWLFYRPIMAILLAGSALLVFAIPAKNKLIKKSQPKTSVTHQGKQGKPAPVKKTVSPSVAKTRSKPVRAVVKPQTMPPPPPPPKVM